MPIAGPEQDNYERQTVAWLIRYACQHVIMDALAGNLRKAESIARIRQFDGREAELARQREEIRLQEAEVGDVPTPVIPAFVERPGNLIPQLSGLDLMNNIEWYKTHDPHPSTRDPNTCWRMERRVGVGYYGYVSFWTKLSEDGTIIDVSISSLTVSIGNTDTSRESS